MQLTGDMASFCITDHVVANGLQGAQRWLDALLNG
jgi:hypothetical protein